jgi:hypothetical protein
VHSRGRSLEVIESVLALLCSKQYLLHKLLQVLLIDIMLEALSLMCDHLGEEHLRVVERWDHYAGKPGHLVQGEPLL